jgi:hypothetical protein
MAITHDDFMKAATESGRLGEFSQYDLDLAQKYPEFGMTALSYKNDYANATTDEQRLLINEWLNASRKSYGNYTAGTDGLGYYSTGLLQQEEDNALDQMRSWPEFEFGSAPTYSNQYAADQTRLLDAIINREDFAWSKETDPLWSDYKKSYLREGERATSNALAQSSAASGGRPSSYAVNAATQAGDYYATKATDMIPALYQQAYDKYLKEYGMKLSDLGAVNTQEQMDYGKYLDTLGQFNTDRNFAYNDYMDDFGRLQTYLGNVRDQDNLEYGRDLDTITLRRQAEQQAFDNAVLITEMYGYVPAELADIIGLPAGTQTSSQAYINWQMARAGGGGSGGGGGGGGTLSSAEDDDWFAAIMGDDTGTGTGKTPVKQRTDEEIAQEASQYVIAHPNVALDSQTLDYWLNDNGYGGQSGQKFKAYMQKYGAKYARR